MFMPVTDNLGLAVLSESFISPSRGPCPSPTAHWLLQSQALIAYSHQRWVTNCRLPIKGQVREKGGGGMWGEGGVEGAVWGGD